MTEAEKPSGGAPAAPKSTPIPFAKFLETIPPSQAMSVTGFWTRSTIEPDTDELAVPEIQIHCTSDICGDDLRFVRYSGGKREFPINSERPIYTYITYRCSNCQQVTKVYALRAVRGEADAGQCHKFGEEPLYGSHNTPARLINLFGADGKIFLKGRQCENHGLGIGAFTYYRRVVENHKNQILDEIIKICRKESAPAELMKELEDAKLETQFYKAVGTFKHALPPLLLIDGHNPLTLLHSALSGGVHEFTDEQCLELAHTARLVLVGLTDRVGQALKDEAELKIAVSRLLKSDREKKRNKNTN